MTLIVLEPLENYGIPRITVRMWLVCFLGALGGGGGEIWRQFLICVMLSKVYFIEKLLVQQPIIRRVKGRGSHFLAFKFIRSLKLTILCKNMFEYLKLYS